MVRTLRVMLLTLAAVFPAALLAAQDEDVDALQQVFTAAVKRVAPCIVSIEVEWKPGKALLPATPTMPALQRGNGPVSGVIVSADGLIVTSDFGVNADARKVTVKLSDGRAFPAKLLGVDVSRGIQLLQIDATGLAVPAFAADTDVKVGRWALACGAGEGGTPTLSVGIVSATERISGRAMQIDASTNPSNYGGAVLDAQGELMGIITPLTMAGTRAGITLYDSGIAFAVPIADILEQMPKLKAGETVQAAFLGIKFDMRKMTGGALVQEVLKDTGAEKSGMKAGDVIVEFNREPIHTSFKLLHVIGKCRVGDTVTFKIQRDGKTQEFTATLGARPDDTP